MSMNSSPPLSQALLIKLAKLEIDNENLRKASQDFTEEFRSLKLTNTALNEQLLLANNLVRDSSHTITKLLGEKHALETEANILKNFLKRGSQANLDAVESAESKDSSSSTLILKVAHTNAKNAGLEAQLKACSDLAAERLCAYDALGEKYKKLNGEHQEVLERLHRLEDAEDVQKSEARAVLAFFENEKNVFHSQLAFLEEKCIVSENEALVSSAKVERLEQELHQLKKELILLEERLEHEIETSVRRNAQYEATIDKNIEEHNAMVKELNTTIAKVRKELEESGQRFEKEVILFQLSKQKLAQCQIANQKLKEAFIQERNRVRDLLVERSVLDKELEEKQLQMVSSSIQSSLQRNAVAAYSYMQSNMHQQAATPFQLSEHPTPQVPGRHNTTHDGKTISQQMRTP